MIKNRVDHIYCCLSYFSLCGSPNVDTIRIQPMCKICLTLELQDNFCPLSSRGCQAVREGEVKIEIRSFPE